LHGVIWTLQQKSPRHYVCTSKTWWCVKIVRFCLTGCAHHEPKPSARARPKVVLHGIDVRADPSTSGAQVSGDLALRHGKNPVRTRAAPWRRCKPSLVAGAGARGRCRPRPHWSTVQFASGGEARGRRAAVPHPIACCRSPWPPSRGNCHGRRAVSDRRVVEDAETFLQCSALHHCVASPPPCRR
jgi:hypothetical protein